MSRGEAFGLERYIKIIQCQILNILMDKKVWPLDRSLGRAISCRINLYMNVDLGYMLFMWN